MSDLGNYTFTLNSEKNLIRLDDSLTNRAFGRILFFDSIFTFYPQLEINLKDKQGVVSEKLFMIEGLQISSHFGRDMKTSNDPNLPPDNLFGYYDNKYAWIKGNINQAEIKNQITGDYIFSLVHQGFITDAPSTMSYSASISDIVKLVLVNSLGFTIGSTSYNIINKDGSIIPMTTPNFFIEDTNPKPVVFYQAGNWGRTFIDTLSKKAVSATYNNSPYHTFINSRGEFYFASVSYLLNQTPICNYRIEETIDSVRDPFVVKDYTMHTGGAEINKKNYNRNIYKIGSQGTVSSVLNPISSQKQKSNGSPSGATPKLTILQNGSLGIGTSITSIDNYGLFDDDDDPVIQPGWQNYLYINSALSYRMELTIFFNPNICAGKVITLTVDKLWEPAFASEYSGSWLVIESRTHMDVEGVPIQILLIAKSSISIDSTHPCVNQFI